MRGRLLNFGMDWTLGRMRRGWRGEGQVYPGSKHSLSLRYNRINVANPPSSGFISLHRWPKTETGPTQITGRFNFRSPRHLTNGPQIQRLYHGALIYGLIHNQLLSYTHPDLAHWHPIFLSSFSFSSPNIFNNGRAWNNIITI